MGFFTKLTIILFGIVLISNIASAEVASKCLAAIEKAMAATTPDPDAIVLVECQYYVFNDLNSATRKNILELAKTTPNVILKDTKLSTVLGILISLHPVEYADEMQAIAPAPSLKQKVVKKPEPAPIPSNSGNRCLPDSFVLDKMITDEAMAVDKLNLQNGTTYDVEHINFSLVLTLLNDSQKRWCPVDEHLQEINRDKLRAAENKVNYASEECAKAKTLSYQAFDKINKDGKCKYRYIVKKYNNALLDQLRYLVPSR